MVRLSPVVFKLCRVGWVCVAPTLHRCALEGKIHKADLLALVEGIPVRLGFVPGRTGQAALQGFSDRGKGAEGKLFLLESEPRAVVIGPQR